jgi:hypothetical protein
MPKRRRSHRYRSLRSSSVKKRKSEIDHEDDSEREYRTSSYYATPPVSPVTPPVLVSPQSVMHEIREFQIVIPELQVEKLIDCHIVDIIGSPSSSKRAVNSHFTPRNRKSRIEDMLQESNHAHCRKERKTQQNSRKHLTPLTRTEIEVSVSGDSDQEEGKPSKSARRNRRFPSERESKSVKAKKERSSSDSGTRNVRRRKSVIKSVKEQTNEEEEPLEVEQVEEYENEYFARKSKKRQSSSKQLPDEAKFKKKPRKPKNEDSVSLLEASQDSQERKRTTRRSRMIKSHQVDDKDSGDYEAEDMPLNQRNKDVDQKTVSKNKAYKSRSENSRDDVHETEEIARKIGSYISKRRRKKSDAVDITSIEDDDRSPREPITKKSPKNSSKTMEQVPIRETRSRFAEGKSFTSNETSNNSFTTISVFPGLVDPTCRVKKKKKKKQLFQEQDESDSNDTYSSTDTFFRSLKLKSSLSTRTIPSKRASNKYPTCMDDMVNFPLARKARDVQLTRLDDEFTERAAKGDVNWNLYARSPQLEETYYQQWKEIQDERKKERSVSRSQSLADSCSSSVTGGPSSPQIRPSKGQSPSKLKDVGYIEDKEKKSASKENEVVTTGKGSHQDNDRIMTRSAKRKRHLKISYLEEEKGKNDTNILVSPTKKGEEMPFLAEKMRDPFSDVRTIRFDDGEEMTVTPEKRVLALCSPPKIQVFKTGIPQGVMENIVKIGEGDEGEVYLSRNPEGKELVLKIIPLDYGLEDDNNEDADTILQAAFAKILPELMVCSAFQSLREDTNNRTPNFIHMKRAACFQGQWPQRLVEEWEKYKRKKPDSENDWHPLTYDAEQHYVIMTLNNGGRDLESFEFNNNRTALSVVLQVAFSLAAAEASLEFEHRDLHWGNILIKETEETEIKYIVDQRSFSVPTSKISVSIIDFSLSRVLKKGTLLHRDLEDEDGLFEGEGDSQFEVYRKMRKESKGDWAKFCPKTNIFWIEYLLDKILHCKNLSKVGANDIKAIEMLEDLYSLVGGYDSCQHLIESQDFQEIVNFDWSSLSSHKAN